MNGPRYAGPAQSGNDPDHDDELTLSPDEIKHLMKELDREDAEESLKDFIRLGWDNVVSPATPFQSNWHIDVICEHLEAVSRGEIKRLLFNMPPRHMKSLGTNVFWVAWDWINNPHRQYLFTTFRTELTVRDSTKSRSLIKSKWYQENWGDRYQLSSDQDNKSRFANDKHGYRLSTSLQGGITGDGGDIVVIDDPHNAKEIHSETKRADVIMTYNESIISRLNDPANSAMILTMQRLHENDLTGHILANEDDWVHVCLPARYEPDHPFVYFDDPRQEPGEPLWESRFNDGALTAIEVPMGSQVAAGQLQQRPAPREGGLFKHKWFDIVEDLPEAPERYVRGWDFAGSRAKSGYKRDFTVGVLMVKCGMVNYIMDMVRFQGTPQEVEAMLRKTAASDGHHVHQHIPQDPGQAGKYQSNYLISQMPGYVVKASPETGSKMTRAEAVAAQAEAGNIKLLKGKWNTDFLNEMCVFPAGQFDDVVDATSRTFHALNQSSGTVRVRSFSF